MKIAVVVASKHGSTREIGEAIAERLRTHGHDVTEHDMTDTVAEALDDAEVLVLGSAVYFGRWTSEAGAFLAGMADRVDGRPVWMFSSGPANPAAVKDPTAEGVEEHTDEGVVAVASMMRALDARGHVVFGGRLELARLTFVERAVTRALRAGDADLRDWDKIRAWADDIAAELAGSGG